MNFELTNTEREYFGLEKVEPNWEKIVLNGDTYREPSILYFEKNTIKKHITSTENRYTERQYNEETINREFIRPKTAKGKEKKLTAAVLETKTPIGVYLYLDRHGDLIIGNHTTKTSFFNSRWENNNQKTEKKLKFWIDNFIKDSDENHLQAINNFKSAKKKNIKFKSGDFFAFKIDRKNYGFGRVLLEINKFRKANVLEKDHGLSYLMGTPVLIKMYPFISENKYINTDLLENLDALPSDYMMDNHLYYGEYEIIGHKKLEENEFEYPISYGKVIKSGSTNVFFQWGFIHKEIPVSKFNKYINGENPFLPEDTYSRHMRNPYGYYSCGFSTNYDKINIVETIRNNNVFDFNKDPYFKTEFDLRNPKNENLKNEIMREFGIEPSLSYEENCKLTGTESTINFLSRI
ncbi:immunity protein 26 of polymorphic toxin system [Flavobacterium sp. 90]|uniref:immunity 26/phosphotriesterase HocA family protein n=1 Tax=Flavobacterium sp. 90 TaxID=2135622 RepID=UPI00104F1916|nr:immunity 26/phosphotriesterase HocA family protein [Flavobacterium sp. 90]TCK56591.1 immunity protein 26 of polymorphic toxin system [Flavobacterium sp. 90]